jgi:hypothetical protein
MFDFLKCSASMRVNRDQGTKLDQVQGHKSGWMVGGCFAFNAWLDGSQAKHGITNHVITERITMPSARQRPTTHHGRRARIAPREDLARQESHSMAAQVALRSADGLAHRQEAMGGRQTTRSGEIAVTLALETSHE